MRLLTTPEWARRYRDFGLSVIPVKPDGSKAPALDTWKELQRRLPTDAELAAWFTGGVGVAVVCGAVSRHLEVLDFDGAATWERWKAAVLGRNPRALDGIPMVRTPGGGMHLYLFRAQAGPSRKVAKRTDGKTLVDLKAERGYVLAPGCPPGCHRSGGTYEWVVDLDACASSAGYRVGA
jgi:hypothetical protein